MSSELSRREIPILLVCFNRPDLLKIVMESLRELQPNRLFVHFDGPRNNSDKIAIEAGTELLNLVDWNVDLSIVKQDRNLGCGLGVFSAVTWFFSNVDYGLIIEDDVLVEPSFLDLLLDYFNSSHSYNLASFSGFNRVPRRKLLEPDASFYRSIYAQSLAWATRKELWEGFNMSNECWEPGFNREILKRLGNKSFQNYWTELLTTQIKPNKLDTWDVQWQAFNWSKRRMFGISTFNYASHIGFGASATHTKSEIVPNWHQKIDVPRRMSEYSPPRYKHDYLADNWSNTHFYPISVRSRVHLGLSQVKSRIRKS